jgi:hypothetical protein
VAATVAAIPAISPTVQAPASAPTAVAAIPAAEPAVGASTTAPKATSASRSKTPLLVGLGVVAALIVGVLAFALLSGDGDDGGDTASAEEEEEDTGLAIGTQSGDFRIGEFVDLEIGPGEDTLYAFDAPPSGFVSFLVDEGDYPGYYRVVDARGKDVASATWIPKEGGMVDPVKLPAVGSYQLQFTPEEPASGSIRVAMYEVPIPKAQEISAGGDEVEMSVDVPGGLAVATFSAEAGERYSITTVGSTRGYYISVRTLAEPRRFALESKWTQEGEDFVDVFVVGVAGDYEIVADPEAADELTSYIRLFLVGDDQVTALTAGEPVEFSTSNPGENAIFTFSGKRDQVVSIRAWDLENGSQILLRRAGVTSTTIESQWAGAPEGALITATLPADADYVITLDGNEANTDAGKVAYYDISKRVTGLVQLGGPPATLKTTAPGQQAVFGLRAAGGEMITMRVLSDDDAYVSVVGPNGNKIIDRQFVGGGSEEKFQRPLVAGDYVILFEPYSPEESTFTIELKSSS